MPLLKHLCLWLYSVSGETPRLVQKVEFVVINASTLIKSLIIERLLKHLH